MKPDARLLACGDTALAVEFGDAIDPALSAAVVALRGRLEAAAPPGIVETVPTFRSLLVHYDPLVTSGEALAAVIGTLLDSPGEPAGAERLWRIPACYEGDHAPDLGAVAEAAGLSTPEVVARHSETPYRVYMLGFLPGYPYLGDLPEVLRLPRRENPRVRVPAGSVAIALAMTAVYTYESPGGWHLLGRTPVTFFDARTTPPALLRPGDAVRFEPVSATEYARLAADTAAGRWRPQPELAP